jgi:hypothetical protein
LRVPKSIKRLQGLQRAHAEKEENGPGERSDEPREVMGPILSVETAM